MTTSYFYIKDETQFLPCNQQFEETYSIKKKQQKTGKKALYIFFAVVWL